MILKGRTEYLHGFYLNIPVYKVVQSRNKYRDTFYFLYNNREYLKFMMCQYIQLCEPYLNSYTITIAREHGWLLSKVLLDCL